MDGPIHTFLSSIHPLKLLSGVGLAYLIAWALFFALVPIIHWFGLGWKLASAVAYATSWVAMLLIFAVWIKPQDSLTSSFMSNTQSVRQALGL